jgi:hypothetical protein
MKQDCDVSRCRKIECWISDMAANTEVIIEMTARPWNQTLREVQITQFPVTSVAVLHLPPEISHQLTSHLSLPLVIRVSTIVRLVGSRFDGNCPNSSSCTLHLFLYLILVQFKFTLFHTNSDVVSLHSVLIAICCGISVLTFIVFVLERMDFFKSSERSSRRASLQHSQSESLLARTILNQSLRSAYSTDYSAMVNGSRLESDEEDNALVRQVYHDQTPDEHASDCECNMADSIDRSLDRQSNRSSRPCFDSSFDRLSESAASSSAIARLMTHDSPIEYCELHGERRSRLSARQLCREKLYDQLHYARNHNAYNFYQDLSRHEPNCPFYASRRSLVSYK